MHIFLFLFCIFFFFFRRFNSFYSQVRIVVYWVESALFFFSSIFSFDYQVYLNFLVLIFLNLSVLHPFLYSYTKSQLGHIVTFWFSLFLDCLPKAATRSRIILSCLFVCLIVFFNFRRDVCQSSSN